jgi:hypothetical protein
MALVSTSIPNLLNGVSQQPSPLRQVTQGETQTNALSSVIDGLIKRPPTEHINTLERPFNVEFTDDSAVHWVDRGVDGRHCVIVNGGQHPTVSVYDETGNLLHNSSNQYYLYCENPAKDIEFLTVADTTFILNKTKTVAMNAATVPGTLVTSEKYQGFEDLPVETSTHHVGDGNTSRFPVGFNFHDPMDLRVRVNGTLYLLNSNYFLEDDNKTIRFPTNPPNHATIVFSLEPNVGDIIEVIGDSGNAFDSFYVKSVSKSAYEETVKPGITYQLDASTMPLVLRPGPVPQIPFTLLEATWLDREVGDLDSAPDPSFVGKKISNMFFYKNRLGFLSEENVIFSGAGDYFRFFPKTVTTVLDDGPIDVTASHTKVSRLNSAIPFNESLTLFSEQSQFTIQNAGNLTPKTISIVPSTEFENDADVSPVGAGNNIYFSSKKGDFSSIREYYIQADTIMSDALEVTAHVPKYVPKNLVKLATSSNEDILVALSADERSKLYVYKWFTDGTQKLQSSWSTWELSDDSFIVDATIIENNLKLVIKRGSSLFFENIDLQHLDDAGLNFCVRADRKTSLTGTYDSGTDTTTWTLPYTYDGPVHVVKSGSWPERKGANITNYRDGIHTYVRATGDYSAYPVIIGIPYDMTYEFSTQHVREKNGTQSIQSGRLQLRTMRVNYENTGYFKIEVTPYARQTYSYEYTGVVLNQLGSTIGDVSLEDGTYRFPVQSKNDRVSIKLVSDSYLPCAFQNAEWEGFYNIRSKRI